MARYSRDLCVVQCTKVNSRSQLHRDRVYDLVLVVDDDVTDRSYLVV